MRLRRRWPWPILRPAPTAHLTWSADNREACGDWSAWAELLASCEHGARGRARRGLIHCDRDRLRHGLQRAHRPARARQLAQEADSPLRRRPGEARYEQVALWPGRTLSISARLSSNDIG